MNPPPMTIRELTDRDWPEVDAIQRLSYPPAAVENLDALRCHARLSPTTCLAAEAAGRLLGYVLAHPWPHRQMPPLNTVYAAIPARADSLYLHDLTTAPAARGRGVATALVRVLFAEALRLGCTSSSLLAVQDAPGFWARFGYGEAPAVTLQFQPAFHRIFPGLAFRYMELELRRATA
ncbi:MAG: GNAT family N-acetyltransferase [Opitutae bacterium]|nr:GNAT family N-acetyltransferase [Opitutae bacterium]